MAFIRVKKIKNWRYAYLVENKWKSRGARQKVKQYLGRVHKIEHNEKIPEPDISSTGFKDSIKELLKYSLVSSGFSENKGILEKEKIKFDISSFEFLEGKKPVVLESNEGFMCKMTVRELFNFRKSEDEEKTALRLANAVLGAGLNVKGELFVRLFEKVQKPVMPVLENTQNFINNAK